ncbi:MAG: dihydrofolate reductase, partial [Peptococcaceae bacterium]|nr:dihydrofolate reductase [Peptococcaceae bacterium]
RQNIVVTSTIKELAGCQIASSLKEAIELAEREQIFIIGGSMLYAEALPMADVLDLTFVHEKPEGDTFFPEINRELYKETERKDFDGNPPYSFVTYQRKS